MRCLRARRTNLTPGIHVSRRVKQALTARRRRIHGCSETAEAFAGGGVARRPASS